MAETYMVRLGPPAHGDVIHTNECRHALKHPNALRWVWADRQGFDNIDWGALRRHGINACRICRPDLLGTREEAAHA